VVVVLPRMPKIEAQAGCCQERKAASRDCGSKQNERVLLRAIIKTKGSCMSEIRVGAVEVTHDESVYPVQAQVRSDRAG